MSAFNSDLKYENATRRAASLRQNRAEYAKRSSVACNGRSLSAAPRGSDFAAPHRAARVAKRSLLSQDAITASADMPQISMGREGTWSRWIRKPSVAKLGNQAIENWDGNEHVIEALEANGAHSSDFESAWHANEHGSHSTFDMTIDLDDEKAFPRLVASQTTVEPKVTTSEAESEVALELTEAMLTPEKLLQTVASVQSSMHEAENGVVEDWVIVPSRVASKADRSPCAVARVTNQTMRKEDSKETGSGMDWSQAGMPTSFIKRLFLGSQNASHRSPYARNKDAAVPMQVLRAQSNGSSKRERSTSAPRTPRSQSKARAIKQPQNRR